MAIDFAKLDKKIDWDGLKKDVEEAKKNGGNDFPTIPAGVYEVKVEGLTLKEPKKDPDGLMLEMRFKILSGEHKGQNIWVYKKFVNNKRPSDDAKNLAWIETFLKSLDSGVEIAYSNMSSLNSLIMEVEEAIDEKLEYSVNYDPDAWNDKVVINEVFEVED